MNDLRSDVRLWHAKSGIPVGVGFVATPWLVVTCAHVVADALGDRTLATRRTPPSAPIDIDFPALARSPVTEKRTATVRGWSAIGANAPDDIAILQLDLPAPEAMQPIEICKSYSFNDRIIAYGVRAGLPKGAYVEAKVLGLVPGPHLEVVSNDTDSALRQGCSGGAAWNVDRGGVLGMVAMGQLERSGLLIPIDQIADFFHTTTGEDLAQADPPQNGALTLNFAVEGIRIEILVSALCRLPLGPAVDGMLIRLNIIRAFATATDRRSALDTVAEANGLLLKSLPKLPFNPTAYTIEAASLPPSSVPPLDLWSDIFANACMLGPRMVGALLLAAPAPVIAGAKDRILELFFKLGEAT